MSERLASNMTCTAIDRTVEGYELVDDGWCITDFVKDGTATEVLEHKKAKHREYIESQVPKFRAKYPAAAIDITYKEQSHHYLGTLGRGLLFGFFIVIWKPKT